MPEMENWSQQRFSVKLNCVLSSSAAESAFRIICTSSISLLGVVESSPNVSPELIRFATCLFIRVTFLSECRIYFVIGRWNNTRDRGNIHN